MRKLNANDATFRQSLAEIRKGLLTERLILQSRTEYQAVLEIIDRVRAGGDATLCALTQQFDQATISPDRLAVTAAEMAAAEQTLSSDLSHAIDVAIENVRRYQTHLRVMQTQPMTSPGVELRTRYRPLERVGIYVPGGSAPLVSTVIMTAVPAIVAGVKEIVICSPPRTNNDIHPAMLAVCKRLGIGEVYRVGGSQAIAAMGLGTATIRAVDKIVGPGNAYVQLAKKALFGVVDIDSFAGPSEIVVLADADADPTFVAADLLGQAEHAPGSAILVTPSKTLADAVDAEIEVLLKRSDRAEATRKCLDEYSAIVVSESFDAAVALVNELAPEHLSVQTAQADAVADRCVTAGAIFVGAYTSEALGDYAAGPSHVLPTGGTARFFSPLNAMDFIRHTSVIRYDRPALSAIYPTIKAFAEVEMLPAHLLSATVRLESK